MLKRRPVYRASDGVVINVIKAEDDFDPGEGLLLGAEGAQIGDTWDGASYIPKPGPPFDAAVAKAELVERAWNKSNTLQETLRVEVSGHDYGCDAFTQSSMNAFATAIANGVAPDPIVFTPKGEMDGVEHTHEDFVTVSVAVMDKTDSIIKAYLGHKKAISLLADDEAEIAAYDLSTGWPT